MNRKPRSDSKLAKLSGAQAEQLWAWMRSGASYKTIVELVKSEFQVETSTRALSEWWEDRAEQESRELILRASNVADRVGEEYAQKIPQLEKAIKGSLMNSVFEAVATGADPKRIESLMNMVAAITQGELTKARLQLDLEKFRESIKTQQEKALDALFAEVRGNKQAEQLFLKFRDAVRGAVQEAA